MFSVVAFKTLIFH